MRKQRETEQIADRARTNAEWARQDAELKRMCVEYAEQKARKQAMIDARIKAFCGGTPIMRVTETTSTHENW